MIIILLTIILIILTIMMHTDESLPELWGLPCSGDYLQGAPLVLSGHTNTDTQVTIM